MQNPSILDGIRVASPCQASWDAMKGDDVSRFCGDCSRNVYDISALKTSDALALIAGREGQLCVRFYRRADGTVLTADCPVGAEENRPGRFRKITGLGLVGLAMPMTSLAYVGRRENPENSSESGSAGSLDGWVAWALIKIGWRKPPQRVMGALPIRSQGETTSADDF